MARGRSREVNLNRKEDEGAGEGGCLAGGKPRDGI